MSNYRSYLDNNLPPDKSKNKLPPDKFQISKSSSGNLDCLSDNKGAEPTISSKTSHLDAGKCNKNFDTDALLQNFGCGSSISSSAVSTVKEQIPNQKNPISSIGQEQSFHTQVNPQRKSRDLNILEEHNVQIESMDHEASQSSFSEDESQFQDVVNRKRKRSNSTKVDLSNFNIKNGKTLSNNTTQSSQNRFAVLGELNIEQEIHNPIGGNNNLLKNSQKKVSRKENSFCPPIFLFNVNIENLVEQLNAKNVEYKITNKSKFKSKLFLKDISVHEEMMQLLRDKKIDSYSFTPLEKKRANVVIRGLYFKTDLVTLKNEIDFNVPDTVDTVSKFSTPYSKKQGFDTGLFLVTLKLGRSLNEVTNIKYILNQKISWESPKKNSKEIQCWRCQQWGHMSNNCNRQYRCIKCDKDHGPGDCQFISSKDNLPFCNNCKQFGHPSNYKGCSAFIKYIEYKKTVKSGAYARKQQVSDNVLNALTNSNFIQHGKSFASHFQANNFKTSHRINSSSPLIKEFLKIAQIICPSETLSLEEKIGNFVKDYRKLSKDEAKQQCRALLNELHNYYDP